MYNTSINGVLLSWVSEILTTKKCSFSQFSDAAQPLTALPRGRSSPQAPTQEAPMVHQRNTILSPHRPQKFYLRAAGRLPGKFYCSAKPFFRAIPNKGSSNSRNLYNIRAIPKVQYIFRTQPSVFNMLTA